MRIDSPTLAAQADSSGFRTRSISRTHSGETNDPWNSASFPTIAVPTVRSARPGTKIFSRPRSPIGWLSRDLVFEHQKPGRAHHLQGRRAYRAHPVRLRGAAARLLSPAAGRARGQHHRPAHRRPLHAGHRYGLLSQEARVAWARPELHARRHGAVDRADAQALEQQGAGRLRRPVLEGQENAARMSAGAEAASAGRHCGRQHGRIGGAGRPAWADGANRRFHSDPAPAALRRHVGQGADCRRPQAPSPRSAHLPGDLRGGDRQGSGRGHARGPIPA